ncbi:hypothetical protein LINGRAHAP2_LOCUS2524 [Linum grandiflorum]
MAPKPPDPLSGVCRPPSGSSSLKAKCGGDSQQVRKKARAMDMNCRSETEDVVIEDVPENNPGFEASSDQEMSDRLETGNPWNQGARQFFERTKDWYVADSDSEDVAADLREEDDDFDDDEDPLCPSIAFSAAEKASFRREWRSALVVKGLGRRLSYLPLARRLNYLWARNVDIQITDLTNGCYLVRFRQKEDYENAEEGARAKYARVCVEVDLTKPLLSKYKIEGVKYYVGYEGLENLCTNCGRYGAPTSRCTYRDPPKETAPMVDDEEVVVDKPADIEPIYGDWMHGRPKGKRQGRKSSAPSIPTSQRHHAGSSQQVKVSNKFEALQEDMEENSDSSRLKANSTEKMKPTDQIGEEDSYKLKKMTVNPIFSQPLNDNGPCITHVSTKATPPYMGLDQKMDTALQEVKKGVGSKGPGRDAKQRTQYQAMGFDPRSTKADGAGNLSPLVNK